MNTFTDVLNRLESVQGALADAMMIQERMMHTLGIMPAPMPEEGVNTRSQGECEMLNAVASNIDVMYGRVVQLTALVNATDHALNGDTAVDVAMSKDPRPLKKSMTSAPYKEDMCIPTSWGTTNE